MCVQKIPGWDLRKEEQRERTRAMGCTEQGYAQEALHPHQPGAECESQVERSEPGKASGRAGRKSEEGGDRQ